MAGSALGKGFGVPIPGRWDVRLHAPACHLLQGESGCFIPLTARYLWPGVGQEGLEALLTQITPDLGLWVWGQKLPCPIPSLPSFGKPREGAVRVIEEA